MKYEKSCGAILWRNNNGKREYLLVLNRKGNALGHWGFPKGHVEGNETETQTAIREIYEETGLRVTSFADGFRVVSRYNPASDIEKDVVYFLAEITDTNIVLQQSEVAEYKWLDYDATKQQLSYDTSLIEKAESFLSFGRHE
ncbi:MAG: NUDIX domain-containing protein [Clostridia bacterium]|nr:NUDIX domain-containing protein [Clostridia bacterium]